jgi:pSer/pThr/pTyr-binding forkhead associated (FHA) protein
LRLRLERSGSPAVECRAFDAPYVVIGRDRRADLVLDHKDVCARHAYLQVIGGRLYCIDLGSSSGIALGGELQRAGWVEPEQSVRIGPYRIRLAADDGIALGSAAAGYEAPSVIVDLSHRGYKASQLVLSSELSLVGSASDCQVRLLDPAVSSTHCSLVATRLGTWVVDLLGKGGIQVGGTPVRYALLEPGDELRVGRSSIRIRQDKTFAERMATIETREGSVSAPAPAVEEPEASWSPFPSFAEADPDSGPEIAAETELSLSLHSTIRRRQIEDERLAALSARERRASCRYPVADAEAVLSWWEPVPSASVVPPASSDERKPSEPETEESIYRRVMARWPGSHDGSPAERATAELVRDPLPAVEESMQSRVSSARLLDISQTGVLVLSEEVPPAGERIWFRLETPQITDWVEVVPKGSAPGTAGAHRVRLAFREACPYDVFRAVVYKKPGS